jgi:hypothetical protein
MASIETEQAERDLAELQIVLGALYGSRNSNSGTIPNLRSFDMFEAERRMKELVRGVLPEHIIQLTVGRERVEATEFHLDNNSKPYRIEKKLAPGYQLPLRRVNYAGYHDTESQRMVRRLYVGWIARLTLGAVAKTLREEEGGKLAIVSFRPAETQAQAA